MHTENGTYTLLLLGWLRSSYEKDPETGYNYYGARYYTDRLSIWLSVDPLTDNYPSLSGYNYCANNPVMLVDPDGMQPTAVKALRMPKRIKALWNYWCAIRAAKVGGAVAGGWYLGNYLPKEELNTKAEEVINSITEGAVQNNVNNESQSSTSSSKTATASPNIDLDDLNPKKDNSKNEKHGDGGRAKSKAEKQIKDLEEQAKNTSNKKEREKINRKIINIRENAARKAKGEEHSRGSKR